MLETLHCLSWWCAAFSDALAAKNSKAIYRLESVLVSCLLDDKLFLSFEGLSISIYASGFASQNSVLLLLLQHFKGEKKKILIGTELLMSSCQKQDIKCAGNVKLCA